MSAEKARGKAAPAPRGDAADGDEGLIWGLNPVLEALRTLGGGAGRGVHEVRVLKGKAGPRVREVVDLARTRGLPLRFVPEERLGPPKGARHQGVAVRLAETTFLGLDELLEDAQGRPLLVLDCIQDPHNLGSIFRSALAAGFAHIILPKDRSAPVGGTTAKSAAGAVERLRICRVANLAETLRTLKERGYWIFGAVADADAASLYEVDFPEAACIVVGGEGKGIRPLVRKRCDRLFTIPMPGCFNSLNASAAAAVILFEFARRAR